LRPVVTPGFDPIIGQAAGSGPREMDEPFPNYPAATGGQRWKYRTSSWC
jgi:hypothetical protein